MYFKNNFLDEIISRVRTFIFGQFIIRRIHTIAYNGLAYVCFISSQMQKIRAPKVVVFYIKIKFIIKQPCNRPLYVNNQLYSNVLSFLSQNT